jgi:hypothetical protein
MATETQLQTARKVEEALAVLSNNGVLHEDMANDLWSDYMRTVLGMTGDEWNEVA